MQGQNAYKRTVAGSVGAGMGAIFNGSGRTYYILEHKTTSKYHNAGESQKIIIDQIEIGRDSSCQVRYDESFETVSRKHAAIVRDGQNWQLVHLSTANPTLVNGRPIQGSYYLQSGDEIQLSVGGPRLGFIVPQGKQALTSSIRLTERMNLFRQQALAPYKRWLWILASLLVLAIAAGTYVTCTQQKQLDDQQEQILMQTEMLNAQNDSLEALKQQYLDILKKDPNNEQARRMAADINMQQQRIRSRIIYINRPDYRPDRDELPAPTPTPLPEPEPAPAPAPAPGANSDARGYYGSIYRIIVESITIELPDGSSRPSNLSTSKIDCGTGFITPSGAFVTARQNIHPWIYVDGKEPADNWRKRLAVLYALGCDIIMNYSAYSTDGTAQRLQFSSRDFEFTQGGDIKTAHFTITEEELTYYEGLGLTGVVIDRKQLLKEGIDFKHSTSSGRAWVALPGTGRVGIPTDAGASNSIAGGTELTVVYYSSSNVRDLASVAQYQTVHTQNADTRGGTIVLQNGLSRSAFGAPVFMREPDGSLYVVGMYVGGTRVVPIRSLP